MDSTTMVSRLTEAAEFLTGYSELLEYDSYWSVTNRNPSLSFDETTYLDFFVSPHAGNITVTCHGPDALDVMTRIRRSVGGKWDKRFAGSSFQLIRNYSDELRVILTAERDTVCTSRVVGKETVTVPDYANAPVREVEKDIIEYDCPESLLA